MSRPLGFPSEPKEFWDCFYRVTQVPRPSKKEEKFIAFLEEFASDNNVKYSKDSAGNIVMYVEATDGYENHPTVIVQSHMDMVCDKTPDKQFDFENDPIDLLVENGWVTADRTTLGADNGLGVAASLAIIKSSNIAHPSLELLFTVDEETGLNGALDLDVSLLKGTRLINLDTEEWGAAYVGCAGGVDYELRGRFPLVDVGEGLVPVKIVIGNLKGGHSRMNIHEGRGNSIKILSEILFELQDLNIHLVSFNGGAAHNIIPRDAQVSFWIDFENIDKLKKIVSRKKESLLSYLPKEDNDLTLILEENIKIDHYALDKKQKSRFISLLAAFPHGARNYNWQADNPIVTYSSNFAICNFSEGRINILTSLRFLERAEALQLEQEIYNISNLFRLKIKQGKAYPSWKPVFESELLTIFKQVYREKFGQELKVKAIHAGLECGILKDKIGDHLDTISLGPNIEGVHSPSEKLEIDSTNKFWSFFSKLLESL